MNIAMLLEMVAEGAPDRVVVGARAQGPNAAQLLAQARSAAARFQAADVEHIAFVDLNSEAFPIALFGAAMAGLPFAPVNYRLTDEQLGAVLRRLVPGLVVVGDDIVPRLGSVEGLQVLTRNELLDSTPTGGDDIDLPFVDPDDIAILLFTSGTTGEPKAAVLRHRHLTSYIITSVEFLGADGDEAQLVSVPPYHVAGVSAVLSSLYSGRRIVYLPTFDAEAWIRTVSEEAVSQAMLVPTMLGRVLDRIEASGLGLPSLRHLSYGGGRMSLDLIERAMTLLPDVRYVNAYGLTETSSTISVLTPEDHREAVASADPAIRRRLTSVGRPLPTIELEIRDAEGNVVPTGERGEICVRGEQVAGEYLGRSVLTDDGWFPTNDVGWVDDDGFLYLDGRLDDVIVRGAENLSPGEIEDTLLSHPAVAEAAVVGIPDSEWGEAVAAAVVLTAGQQVSGDELKRWVRDRLRSTKTPQVIQIRGEMPYNETGKLLRRVIRDELSTSG
jgi:acyl-CoA synthetase (AMP-forming)/AMP-acid ligase II